jgi:serine/threonine-protein kinase RsbW
MNGFLNVADDPNGFSARYPSAFRSVAQARHAVADFALDCGFDLTEVCDIALAVGEACNNAVEHGHVEQGAILVGCKFDGVDLKVEVSDHGRGFDARAIANALANQHRGERGLGIFLMRTLMDRVEYVSDSGTSVHLTKRRHL